MRELIINYNNTIVNAEFINLFDTIFKSFGYIGGGLLSLCLFPQIHKAIKTKSTSDISYVWQSLSIVGLIFFEIYGLFFLLYPVFIPVTLELILMIILTSLKCYYDSRKKLEDN